MPNEPGWEQFRDMLAYRFALRASFLYLPVIGHLATWLGLASRLNSYRFLSLEAHFYVGMASVPLLVVPALLAGGLVNLLDLLAPRGCYIYASLLFIFAVAAMGGGLFVGPLLDF